ncbi:MAG: hypothetical protein GY863_17585 [bacterium]|nr:hypothetical protein [bacterium]
MNKSKIIQYLPVLALMLLIPLLITTAAEKQRNNSDTDYSMMDRDIKVMAKILQTELTDKYTGIYFKASRTKGTYLEGYGLVFTMPLTTKIYKGRSARTAKEQYDDVIDKLIGVLKEYGDVVKQVRPDERFTLVASPSRYGVIDGYYNNVIAVSSRDARFEPYPFIMSAEFRDIQKLGSGDLSLEQFKNSLEFEVFGTIDSQYISPKTHREINIMKGILEVGLEEGLSTSISSESVQGTYLKDFGVLFTVNASKSRRYHFDSDNISISMQGEFDTGKDTEQIDLSDMQESLGKINYELSKYGVPLNFYIDREKLLQISEEEVENAIDVITGILSEYGSKVRGLTNNDKIAVQFQSRDYKYGPGLNTKLIHVTDYKDIMDYSRGRLSLEELKSRVTLHKIGE